MIFDDKFDQEDQQYLGSWPLLESKASGVSCMITIVEFIHEDGSLGWTYYVAGSESPTHVIGLLEITKGALVNEQLGSD